MLVPPLAGCDVVDSGDSLDGDREDDPVDSRERLVALRIGWLEGTGSAPLENTVIEEPEGFVVAEVEEAPAWVA